MNTIKALTFDTGGTILDWYTGISEKLTALGKKRNIEADWPSITHQYRINSLIAMTGGDEEFRPEFNIDDVHLQQIEEVLAANSVSAFTTEDFEEVRQLWHELECWPDVPSGLARLRSKFIVASLTILSNRLIVDTCKRADIVWDTVISCESIGVYKPRPQAYTQAADWLQLDPSECLMVAAHGLDLTAAARTGYKTAFVRRPTEWGPLGEPEFMKSEESFDFVADDFHDLADQLDCAR
ncbi:MAG: haloacid dehalogenase type II [Halieaceae bacterium]